MGGLGAQSLQDGLIKYASGNTAVAVCGGDAGQVLTVYSDKKKPQVLAMFNSLGIGCVCYANGKPWLVVTGDGWTLSDKMGNMVDKGKFPRTGQEIRCEPTEHVLVCFTNRQQISVTYDNDGERQTWDCGERLKRSESHLDKVVGCSPNGKLQLDVAAIRARQATTGSAYMISGPHTYVTEHTGLGSLKTALKTIRPGGEVAQAVQALQRSDARVKLIDTLPMPVYGTARESPLAGTALSQHSQQPAESASPSNTLGLTTGSLGTRTLSSPLLPDYGKPPMTSRQRRWQREGSAYGKPKPWVRSRAKLEPISLAQVQTSVLGPDAPRDQLCCVCLLADWQPTCGRLLPKLEEGWGHVLADAAAHPEGGSPRIKVYHLDASEGDVLQKRYQFRTVPMFLMYYQGKLVYASNNISTKEDLFSACQQALVAGRKGEYLPDSFSFAGRDNSLLNHITPLMTLTGA